MLFEGRGGWEKKRSSLTRAGDDSVLRCGHSPGFGHGINGEWVSLLAGSFLGDSSFSSFGLSFADRSGHSVTISVMGFLHPFFSSFFFLRFFETLPFLLKYQLFPCGQGPEFCRTGQSRSG